MKNQMRTVFWIVSFPELILSLSACLSNTITAQPSFQEWLQIPIPEENLFAYHNERGPFENEKQAVIAVRALFLTSRIQPVDIPNVVSVEFIPYKDAIRYYKQDDICVGPDFDQKVWLVEFEGIWKFYSIPGPDEQKPNLTPFAARLHALLCPRGGIANTWTGE